MQVRAGGQDPRCPAPPAPTTRAGSARASARIPEGAQLRAPHGRPRSSCVLKFKRGELWPRRHRGEVEALGAQPEGSRPPGPGPRPSDLCPAPGRSGPLDDQQALVPAASSPGTRRYAAPRRPGPGSSALWRSFVVHAAPWPIGGPTGGGGGGQRLPWAPDRGLRLYLDATSSRASELRTRSRSPDAGPAGCGAQPHHAAAPVPAQEGRRFPELSAV